MCQFRHDTVPSCPGQDSERAKVAHPFKSTALELYNSSRKSYSILSKTFAIPSASTLKRAMANFDVQPGVSHKVLKVVKTLLQNMTPIEKLSALCADEMALYTRLDLNPQGDYIEGFEDYGKHGRTNNVADHALVFSIRGILICYVSSLP